MRTRFRIVFGGSGIAKDSLRVSDELSPDNPAGTARVDRDLTLPGIVVMFQSDVVPGVLIDARCGFFQRVGLKR